MYCATMLSNKLVNCEQLSTNVTRKTLENEILQSPCIVKSSKAIFLFNFILSLSLNNNLKVSIINMYTLYYIYLI